MKRIVMIAAALSMLAAAMNAAAQTPTPTPTTAYNVAYRTGTGYWSNFWRLDYVKPYSPPSHPMPAIVMIHGGGWIEGDKSSFMPWEQEWANNGFFVMAINFRLATKPTYAPFNQPDPTPGYDTDDDYPGPPTWPWAIEDCKNAIRWLRAHAAELNVDPNRIGVWGNSAGGHLAMMCGLLSKQYGYNYEGDGPYQEYSSDVCGVASDSGVVNLNQDDPRGNYTLPGDFNLLLTGIFEQVPPMEKRLEASCDSYTTHAAQLPPFLMQYGLYDGSVPYYITDDFVNALIGGGIVDMTYSKYPTDHCPFSLQNSQPAETELLAWFTRVVKNQAPPPPRPTPTPTPTPTPSPVPTPPCEVLFSDNFSGANGSALDSSKWIPVLASGTINTRSTTGFQCAFISTGVSYTTRLMSRDSFTRGYNLRCTFKAAKGQSGDDTTYSGIGGPWRSTNDPNESSDNVPILKHMVGALGFATGCVGDHSHMEWDENDCPLGGYLTGPQPDDNFVTAWANSPPAGGGPNWLTCRVYLGDSAGGFLEWSTDNGAHWNQLRDKALGEIIDTRCYPAGTHNPKDWGPTWQNAPIDLNVNGLQTVYLGFGTPQNSIFLDDVSVDRDPLPEPDAAKDWNLFK